MKGGFEIAGPNSDAEPDVEMGQDIKAPVQQAIWHQRSPRSPK